MSKFDKAFFIVLNGPPRSGKDTAGQFFQDELSENGTIIKTHKFAAPIKRVFKSLYNFSDEEMKMYDGCLKDYPSDVFLGRTPREVQISISENWLKPFFGKDIFAKLLLDEVSQCIVRNPACNRVVIVTDCGFDVEMDTLEEVVSKDNILLVQVERPDCNYDNDSRSAITYKDGSVDYVIENNGTTEHLMNSVKKIIESDPKIKRFYSG